MLQDGENHMWLIFAFSKVFSMPLSCLASITCAGKKSKKLLFIISADSVGIFLWEAVSLHYT